MIDWPSFFKAWKKPISSSIKEKINKIGVRLAKLEQFMGGKKAKKGNIKEMGPGPISFIYP
jgi:hypothetical protein